MTSALSTLKINQVSQNPPPLKTPVILWGVYQGELVNCRWVQACNPQSLPTQHINFHQPGVKSTAVWVDENIAYPMRENDLWSSINV
jgi:hypothetical protein